jgi:Thiamine pyrophosphate enzyme, C-terminal TPP binding domain
MAENAVKTAAKPPTTTAEDALRQKSHDANVISGRHLVAKALKNEGADAIFTPRGDGFARAAKLAQPRKEVLCYHSDSAFGVTAFDMEMAKRFETPCVAVVGNNSAMNQIRHGRLAKCGEQDGDVSNLLGDVPFGTFVQMPERLRRGGARGVEGCAGLAQSAQIGGQDRQIGSNQ